MSSIVLANGCSAGREVMSLHERDFKVTQTYRLLYIAYSGAAEVYHLYGR